MSVYTEKYKELRQLIKKIRDKKCFEIFTTTDFFYFMDEKNRGVLVFSDYLMNHRYGFQLFLNNSGLNYLHDLLTVRNETHLGYLNSDCIALSLSSRKDLIEEEIQFLRKNNIRIQQENNLIPYRLKEGIGKQIASKVDLDIAIQYIQYTYALISEEFNDIIEAFNEGKVVVSIFDNVEYRYSIIYRNLPLLETFPKQKAIEKEFVSDFTNSVYVDDVCHLIHTFVPYRSSGVFYESLLIAIYESKEICEYQFMEIDPSQIDKYLLGFLHSVFTKHGLPTSMMFNHRKIYTSLLKTLKAMNIEVSFNRDDDVADETIYQLLLNSPIELLPMEEEQESYYEEKQLEEEYVS